MAQRPRPRGLSPEDAELWDRVARTVRPLNPQRPAPKIPAPKLIAPTVPADGPAAAIRRPRGRVPPASPPAPPPPSAPRPLDRHGLDASWDRQLAKGAVSPDFTLDLHGASLDAAHARLDHGLTLAVAQGARVVLLITGRARPYDPAHRSTRRGAIRARFLDWLEAGQHASRIAAIRPAHPRHGGAGAVYIVLRKARQG